MPQSKIMINGVVGSNDNLPINTLVQLNNQNIGGESTFLWEIVDQPPGALDLLSSSSIQNPTFTPKKEGTYVIRLTVNQGLPTQPPIDEQIVGILQLKTGQRIPGAGETIQDSTAEGWAKANNGYLRAIDALLSDPARIVGVAGAGGLSRGNVLQATGDAIIKPGLPGQETVTSFTLAPATLQANVNGLLVVLEGDVFGNPNPANGALIVCRYVGRFAGAPFSGTPGQVVYVDNTGNLSTTPGTVLRQVGRVLASSGGSSDVMVDSIGGFEVTPINAPYVVFGNPGMLTNAFRIDGSNATALVGNPARFLAGGAATVALQAQGAALQTADLFQLLNNAAGVLAAFGADGSLKFESSGSTTQGIYYPDWNILEDSNGDLTFTGNGNFMIARGGSSVGGTAGAVTWFAQASNARSDSEFGSSSNHAVTFYANNTPFWRVTTAGVLTGVGGARAIQSVLDPVNASDGPTKNYVDGSNKNFVINSRFDFWQRNGGGGSGGQAILGTARSQPAIPVTSAQTVLYIPDRWEVFSLVTLTGHAIQITGSTAVSPFPVGTVAGLEATRAIRVQRDAGSSGANLFVLNQEIDRDFVKQMAGQPLTVSFWARCGADFSGASSAMNCVFNSGTYKGSAGNGLGGAPGDGGESILATPLSYNTGNNNDLNQTFTLTTSYQLFTITIPALRAGVTEAALSFIFQPALAAAGANDWFEVTQIQLSPGPANEPYVLAGRSEEGEIALCQRFFEKSYDLDGTPGGTSQPGEWQTFVPAILVNANALYPFGFQPRFKVNKRVQSNISLWRSTNGTIGQWDIQGLAGAAGAVAAQAQSQSGFEIINNSGSSQTPTAGSASGHWAADAEI